MRASMAGFMSAARAQAFFDRRGASLNKTSVNKPC